MLSRNGGANCAPAVGVPAAVACREIGQALQRLAAALDAIRNGELIGMSCDGTRPEELAYEIGMSAKVLRGWLRREFPRDPADHWQPWYLTHDQVIATRAHFGGGPRSSPWHSTHRPAVVEGSPAEDRRDQAFVTSLVAELLGEEPLRDHRFSWLMGDTGRLLPVDAHFPNHNLVLEYRERQHLADRPDSFSMWDRRMTASGMTRREQRARYDRLRETEIPAHGLRLIVVNADDLGVDRRGRLLRIGEDDMRVLRRILTAHGIPI